MGRSIILFVFICMLLQAAIAVPVDKVDVVVAGYINHGPLQATVAAIKDVTSKYGDKVNVTWVDLQTPEGEDYFKHHGLSAHMNVIINGKYTYEVNGKAVTFQWFEGQQWTKADLDAVISSLLNGSATPLDVAAGGTDNTNTFILLAVAFLALIAIAAVAIRLVKK